MRRSVACVGLFLFSEEGAGLVVVRHRFTPHSGKGNAGFCLVVGFVVGAIGVGPVENRIGLGSAVFAPQSGKIAFRYL